MNDEQSRALRAPFESSLVSLLPKVSCGACAKKNCQKHSPAKCQVCGAWISTAHIHLSYVGHAETTDRLLNVDPEWNWEPLAFDGSGLPLLDAQGGMWMKLTVAGVTRLGYGDAQGKTGPNAVKEAIGDGIRNAAMRFGVALDLWAKSDLGAQFADKETGEIVTGSTSLHDRWWDEWSRLVRAAKDLETLKGLRAEAWGRKKAGKLDEPDWDQADELCKAIKQQLENAPKPTPPDASAAPVGEHSETTPDGTRQDSSVPSGAATASPPPASEGVRSMPTLADEPIGSNGLRKAVITGIKDALLARGYDPDAYIESWAGGPFDRVTTSDLRKLSTEIGNLGPAQQAAS